MTDTNEIQRCAKLARLTIDANELPELTNKFNSILDFVSIIEQVDTDDLSEFSHYPDTGNVLRADAVVHTLTTEQALSNAPDRDGNLFKTPLIVAAE